jgi:hypothetical protein
MNIHPPPQLSCTAAPLYDIPCQVSPLEVVQKQLGLSLKITPNFLFVRYLSFNEQMKNIPCAHFVCNYLFDETEQIYTVTGELELSTKYPRL